MKLPLPTLHRHFRFEITVTEGDKTFTLPLGTGTHNFAVYWGDGSSDKITSATDPDRIHTYTTAGTYIISMRGTCTNFAFNNTGDKLKLKKLLGFIDMGFTTLNFRGCSNLTKVHPSMKVLRSLTTAGSIFRDCSSLISIPAGIFDGAINITSFSSCFTDCTSLTSIPSGLFDNNTAVTIFFGCFGGCSNIDQALDGNMFLYNDKVADFQQTFQYCSKLTGLGWQTIIANAEAQETPPTYTDGCFEGATSLTDYAEIPEAWK